MEQSRLSDTRLALALEAGTLDAASFHHREHIEAAWQFLGREPFATAAARFTGAIRAFATSNGHPEIYHETITWAFLVLIRERMERMPSADWEEFAGANPDLFDQQVLRRFYRKETLASELARRTFILPDRLAEPAA